MGTPHKSISRSFQGVPQHPSRLSAALFRGQLNAKPINHVGVTNVGYCRAAFDDQLQYPNISFIVRRLVVQWVVLVRVHSSEWVACRRGCWDSPEGAAWTSELSRCSYRTERTSLDTGRSRLSLDTKGVSSRSTPKGVIVAWPTNTAEDRASSSQRTAKLLQTPSVYQAAFRHSSQRTSPSLPTLDTRHPRGCPSKLAGRKLTHCCVHGQVQFTVPLDDAQ